MGKRLTPNEVNVLLILAKDGYSLQKRSYKMAGNRFMAVAADGFVAKYALPPTVRSLTDKGYIEPVGEVVNGYGFKYVITEDGKDRAEYLQEVEN